MQSFLRLFYDEAGVSVFLFFPRFENELKGVGATERIYLHRIFAPKKPANVCRMFDGT